MLLFMRLFYEDRTLTLQKRTPLKKKKPERRSAKPLVFIILLVCVTLAVLYVLRFFHRDTHLEERLVANVNSYLHTVPARDVWWLRAPPEISDETYTLFERKRSEILAIINSYRTVSPLAARVCERAASMPLAVITDTVTNISVVVGGEGVLAAAIPRDTAESFKRVMKVEELFYFLRDQNCLFFPALQLAPPFFACAFMHEFGHSMMAMDHASASHTEEEVLMHALSYAVLRKGVPSYQAHIEQLARRSGCRNFKECLASVTPDDLRALDRMVHGREYGKEAARYSVMQHLNTIGFTYVDEHSLPKSMKGEVYEWLGRVSGARKN